MQSRSNNFSKLVFVVVFVWHTYKVMWIISFVIPVIWRILLPYDMAQCNEFKIEHSEIEEKPSRMIWWFWYI